MKELIRFSLSRRFKNRATLAFNIILFIAIMLLCFLDLIMHQVNPSLYHKQAVNCVGMSNDEISYLNTLNNHDYEFVSIKRKNKAEMKIKKMGDKYLVYTTYALDKAQNEMLKMYLNQYRQYQLMQNSKNQKLLSAYNASVEIKNQIKEKQIDISQEKSSLIFMAVTSIYFMMLSFVAAVASEVVNEKATRTLELILTSVSAKVHFVSKMLVGWLVVVIQCAMSLSYIVFWLLVRHIYDHGSGLLDVINRLHLMSIKQKNFVQLLAALDLNADLLLRLTCIIFYLMLGILLIQLIMVIVSSFVSSVEEAGNIQAPFYLVLLAVYYLALSLNSPYDLSAGIGKTLSLLPFFNMLFMPSRILIQNVPISELLISLGGSLALIVVVIIQGAKIYAKGVLDYSGHGIREIIKNHH